MIERRAIDLVIRLSPWLAPVPTAYLIGRAVMAHLAFDIVIAVITALVVETLGLATISIALILYSYNVQKRKIDPKAPVWLAYVLVGVYLVSALTLTVLLDIFPELSRYAPGVFPVMSLVGMTVVMLKASHDKRLVDVEAERQERKAERQARKETKTLQPDIPPKPAITLTPRQSAILDIYKAEPKLSMAEAGRRLNVGRQSIYEQIKNLEIAGVIRRNGNGVEIL